ncbi:glycosyltransferase [Rhizobium sp. ARZ01]|uniref:glycosyltransferase n=1 Tax=Rhizobium sp. ARZ01 TaxID=2769313 RepID=UPI0017809909|nr:glycosyltransferase [Rhizobium sp. ARZ01]MBD9373710.1 glycosyltransferase [Rhizobium sp. ARZ01]
MKIVHVLTRLYRAGSEENTLACCFAQVKHGHEVLLVHGNEYDATLQAAVAKTMRVVNLHPLVHPISPSSDAAAIRQLNRLLCEWHPDIVHTHQSKAGIIGRLAAKQARVPGIIHGVHILPFLHVGRAQKLMFLAAERLTAKFTRAFIDVSQSMRDICIAHRIGGPDQHHVVHSGFDLMRFSHARQPREVSALLGIAPGAPKPPVVLMLAALEPRKRHVEFIEAFAQVVDRIPDVRLLLAGEGPARRDVEAAIARSPVASNIRLIGYHSEPEQLINLADVCVLTSMREGLPRVVMQYLAGGRPCVVSELPGLEEVVWSGVNGVVTPAHDVGAAAAAVANLLENKALCAQLAEGAKRTDLRSWGLDRMCDSVESIYESVLGSLQGPCLSGAKANRAQWHAQ